MHRLVTSVHFIALQMKQQVVYKNLLISGGDKSEMHQGPMEATNVLSIGEDNGEGI